MTQKRNFFSNIAPFFSNPFFSKLKQVLKNFWAQTKQIILISINTTRIAYQAIFINAWWVPALLTSVLALAFLVVLLKSLPILLYTMLFASLSLWLATLVCAVRSSVEKKTRDYFLERIFWLAPIFFLFLLIDSLLSLLTLTPVFYFLLLVIRSILFITTLFIVFFLLDAGYKNMAVRAPLNTLILFKKTYLKTLLLALIFAIFYHLFMAPVLQIIFVLIIVPLFVAFISNFYVKTIYEDTNKYFRS